MIRRAMREDIADIMEIYNDAILNSTATFDMAIRDYDTMREWYESHIGSHHLIVDEEDNKAVAYASLSTYREKQAFDKSLELSIYVHKDYRRRGIADRLMNEIIKIAQDDDRIHTIISVITSENEASIKMHEKFHFAYCGRVMDAGVKFGRYLHVDTYQLMV